MLLWALQGDLAGEDAKAVAERAESIWVSAASLWEANIKAALGKLRLPRDLIELVDDSGFERLSITFDHAVAAGALPHHHGDPFDRMLVAQARLEGLTLATTDASLQRYEVPVLTVSSARR